MISKAGQVVKVAGFLVAAALFLAGCGIGQAAVDQRAGTDKGFISGDGTISTYPVGQRVQAPVLAGELLDGSRFELNDFQGKVVVINFWGQWCAPCRAEADDLVSVYEATKESGVEFLGVNVRDARDKAEAFERSFNVSYPSLYDPAGKVALGFRSTPPNAIPATIILDREHRVAKVFRKPLLAEDLQPKVEKVAGE